MRWTLLFKLQICTSEMFWALPDERWPAWTNCGDIVGCVCKMMVLFLSAVQSWMVWKSFNPRWSETYFRNAVLMSTNQANFHMVQLVLTGPWKISQNSANDQKTNEAATLPMLQLKWCTFAFTNFATEAQSWLQIEGDTWYKYGVQSWNFHVAMSWTGEVWEAQKCWKK